jgi:hypothetical protein
MVANAQQTTDAKLAKKARNQKLAANARAAKARLTRSPNGKVQPFVTPARHDCSKVRTVEAVISPGNGRGKIALLTRENLDGRTKARRMFDAIAFGVAEDLGGDEHLSTIQKHLVEAFAGAAIVVHDINARLMLGEKIDVLEHSQIVSVMIRIAARLGMKRVARDITPSLGQLLKAGQKDFHLTAKQEDD